jgi:predicted SAM-dependent methyltransferase
VVLVVDPARIQELNPNGTNVADPRRGLWLNVGSSTWVIPGFVNLDNSPFLWLADTAPWLGRLLAPRHREAIDEFRRARTRAPIRRHDCQQPLPFRADTVDHILCSHFLEYLARPRMQQVLRDFHRVLRGEGTVHIILPDLAQMAARYVHGEVDADQLQRELGLHPEPGESLTVRLLQLWNGWPLTHHWMYDHASATTQLVDAGFVLENLETPSSQFRADDASSLHLIGVKRARPAPTTPAG